MSETNQNEGWTCPNCGTVHAPDIKKCDCSQKSNDPYMTDDYMRK